MAAPIPTQEPATLLAGDTATWLRSLPDYPASDGWALAYVLINATDKIEISSTASGASHLVNESASVTTDWVAGSYAWRAQASKAGQVFTVATGRIVVQADFAADTLDTRSHARKTLDAVQAYLENPAHLGAASYEIAGRKLQRLSIPDLLVLRDRYQFEVAREEAAALVARGLPDKRRVLVRFGP